LTVSLVALR